MNKTISPMLSMLDRWEWRARHRPVAEARAIRECREELRAFIMDGVADLCEAVREAEAEDANKEPNR